MLCEAMKLICIVYRFVIITVVSCPLRDGINSYLKRIDMFVTLSKAIKIFCHCFLFILLNQMIFTCKTLDASRLKYFGHHMYTLMFSWSSRLLSGLPFQHLTLNIHDERYSRDSCNNLDIFISKDNKFFFMNVWKSA